MQGMAGQGLAGLTPLQAAAAAAAEVGPNPVTGPGTGLNAGGVQVR